MTREEKIKVLQAIQEGRLSPEEIKPSNIYLFSQKDEGNSEGWTSDFGEFTGEQFEDFSRKIDTINLRRLAVGLPPDIIIKIIYQRKINDCENEQEAEK